MIDLNGLCTVTLANAEMRQKRGGHIKADTRSMLKHCATEVVEAMEAYTQTVDCLKHNGCCLNSNFPSELADIVCCVLIIAGKEGIDIEQAITACVEKNRRRAEGIGDKL